MFAPCMGCDRRRRHVCTLGWLSALRRAGSPTHRFVHAGARDPRGAANVPDVRPADGERRPGGWREHRAEGGRGVAVCRAEKLCGFAWRAGTPEAPCCALALGYDLLQALAQV